MPQRLMVFYHLPHRLPMYVRAWRIARNLNYINEREVAAQIRGMGEVCLYCTANKVLPAFGNVLRPFYGALGLSDSPLSWQLHDFISGRCDEEELMLVVRQFRVMQPGRALAEMAASEMEEVENPFSEAEKEQVIDLARELESRFE